MKRELNFQLTLQYSTTSETCSRTTLGEVKSSNLLRSATDKLKNRITLRKVKLKSCHAIEKILSDWHIISFAGNVRPSQPHKSEDVDATV